MHYDRHCVGKNTKAYLQTTDARCGECGCLEMCVMVLLSWEKNRGPLQMVRGQDQGLLRHHTEQQSSVEQKYKNKQQIKCVQNLCEY